VDPRQGLGRSGEDAAARALERAGLSVVARRFRWRGGELDLVAERPDGLVIFVEVKTRSGSRYGAPAEAVTATKRRRLARTALAFLSRTGRQEARTRFDVIEVRADGRGELQLRHIEDAFRLERDP
jgi:putative endonuclease